MANDLKQYDVWISGLMPRRTYKADIHNPNADFDEDTKKFNNLHIDTVWAYDKRHAVKMALAEAKRMGVVF